jgi:hypothetical protein
LSVKEWWQFEGKYQLDFKYKNKILALGIFAVLLLIGITQSVLYLTGQGGQAVLTEQEIQKDKDFINQYKRDESAFNMDTMSQAQPVSKREIDSIQNDLLQKTKNYQLNVTSINNIPAPVASNKNINNKTQVQEKNVTIDGMEYEIAFSGTWESTVRYIRDMQRGSGLLSIRSLSMKPKQSSDLIETSLKYKIYLQ